MRFAFTDIIEDIVGHPVRENSHPNTMLRCPLHEDRRPSLSINLDTGAWLCHSCGEKGGLPKLARLCDGELDEAELAIRSVRAGESSPYYEEAPDFIELATQLHIRARTEQPQALVDYIVSRGFHHEVFRHFKLGWDGVKIALPYFDDGKVVGIKYRYPDGHKDAEKGTRRSVYNIDEVRMKPVVIICEGESDTHAVWSELRRRQASDEVAVCGIPGASVARSQWELWALDLLWARHIYVAFDADEAGQKGANLALEVFGDKAQRITPYIGKDMNEYLLAGGTLERSGIDARDLRAVVN